MSLPEWQQWAIDQAATLHQDRSPCLLFVQKRTTVAPSSDRFESTIDAREAMTAKPSYGRTRDQQRRIFNRGALEPVKGRLRDPRIYNSTRIDPVNLASVPPMSTLLVNSIAVMLHIRRKDPAHDHGKRPLFLIRGSDRTGRNNFKIDN
jgi:hypothetical protein